MSMPQVVLFGHQQHQKEDQEQESPLKNIIIAAYCFDHMPPNDAIHLFYEKDVKDVPALPCRQGLWDQPCATRNDSKTDLRSVPLKLAYRSRCVGSRLMMAMRPPLCSVISGIAAAG